MLAAGIATLINRMQRPLVTVGIDGSVYRFHPKFPQLLDDKIAELIDDNLRVIFVSFHRESMSIMTLYTCFSTN